MNIAIIGAGWYGCHIALTLKKLGHSVTLYEKNSSIFSQSSGKFGVRLHAGPHYPRSQATRESCHRGAVKFKKHYPELVVWLDYSIYGLGVLDSENQPSKVDIPLFKSVCNESPNKQFIEPQKMGYQNLSCAANLNEPSIVIGERLRTFFQQKLEAASIPVQCNTEINYVHKQENGIFSVGDNNFSRSFDKVINATSFQSLLPDDEKLPLDMEVVYQPCIALRYQDKKPTSRPFSFIVMDGWFPCLMPYIEDLQTQDLAPHNYILTHGQWTILGSFNDSSSAYELLNSLTENFIQNYIKPLCEREMNRFYPEFAERFQYLDWKGSVIAKLKTKSEFRSAVTFMHKEVIHIIPGKVSNIFDAEREVLVLLKKENLLTYNNYQFVKNGVLDSSIQEISEKPSTTDNSTCNLQSYSKLQSSLSYKDSFFSKSFPKLTIRSQIVDPVNHLVL
ncbi:MAG: FAD-dependent oxidoreductase [Tatlockia sp.]|nr:FAD-dependent oxidoreductase [Tatlockia sp.]